MTPEPEKTDTHSTRIDPNEAVLLFKPRPWVVETDEANKAQLAKQDDLVDDATSASFERDHADPLRSEPPEPLFGRTLRFALAMRGGISLAVWIGGAVGELDLLRRIRWVEYDVSDPNNPAEKISEERCYFLWPNTDAAEGTPLAESNEQVYARARIYAKLMRSRGYDHVEFDVLAGASAGGLNGVLYSVAQRVGARLDGVLGVWIENGAFWKLVHPSGFGGVDAPLTGDDFFAPKIMQALLRLYTSDTARASHQAHRVVLDISASVIDTQDATERTARSGRAEFHFVGADHRPEMRDDYERREHLRMVPIPVSGVSYDDTLHRVDIPNSLVATASSGVGGRDVVTSLARLAYAARSTSSMPGGFEPALIFSSTSPTICNEDADGNPIRLDMSYAFNGHRFKFDQPFRVVDGGITDNMPIDRALLAIRNQASEVYTDRGLIYLDPAPDVIPIIRTPRNYTGTSISAGLPTPIVRQAHRNDPTSHLLTVVLRTLGLKANKESAEAKAEAVEDFRREVLIARGRSNSLAPLVESGIAGLNTDDALRSYARYRMATDAKLIEDVLTNPGIWQLSTDLPERRNIKAISAIDLTDLDREISSAYRGQAESESLTGQVWTGPLALQDCCLSLLSWVRAIEDAAFSSTGTTRISEIQTAAYGSLTFTPEPTIAGIRGQLYERLADATRSRDVVIATMCDAAAAATASPAQAAVGVLATGNTTAQAVTADAAMMEQLNLIAAQLLQLTEDPRYQPLASPWTFMTADTTVSAIQVAAVCAAAGIPSPVSLTAYAELSAEVETANIADFTALTAKDFRLTLKSIFALKQASDVTETEVKRLYSATTLSPSAKLTGSGLREFAGFLSGDWRRNDWMWGRLDGASGILGFIDALEHRIVSPADEVDLNLTLMREQAQDAILRETRIGQLDPNGPFGLAAAGRIRSTFAPLDTTTDLTDVADVAALRNRVVVGADSLPNLAPGYRMGLGSRAVHSAFRALGRMSSSPPSVLIVFLLQPLGNWIPAVVDLPRLLLLFATLAGAWSVVTIPATASISSLPWNWTWAWGQFGEWRWYWLAVLFVLVVIIFGGRGMSGRIARWNTVISHLGTADAPPSPRREARETVLRYRDTSIRRSRLLFAVGSLMMIVALLAHGLSQLPREASVAAIIAGAVILAAGVLSVQSIAATKGHPTYDRIVTIAAAVVFAAAVVLPGLFALWLTLGGWTGWPTAWGVSPFEASLPFVTGICAVIFSLVCNYGWQAGIPGDRTVTMFWLTLWMIAQAVLAGTVGFAAAWGVELLSHGASSYGVHLLCAFVGLFAAGTLQWYFTQLVDTYVPSDAATRFVNYN